MGIISGRGCIYGAMSYKLRLMSTKQSLEVRKNVEELAAKLEAKAASENKHLLTYMSEQDSAMGEVVARIVKAELDNARGTSTAIS
jgi:hypothetical protein